jgi:Aldo/keto reductase family
MHAAVDSGVTFFDTADVYGDGRSERLVGRLLRERPEEIFVATKIGRRAPLDVSLCEGGLLVKVNKRRHRGCVAGRGRRVGGGELGSSLCCTVGGEVVWWELAPVAHFA